MVCGLSLYRCVHGAMTFIQDVLFKLPTLIPIPLETQEILTKQNKMPLCFLLVEM